MPSSFDIHRELLSFRLLILIKVDDLGAVLGNFTAGGLTFQVSLNSSSFPREELDIKRSDIPSEFYFGVGTSAAQTEGSAKEGGRGSSIWDHFVEQNLDGSLSGCISQEGIDHYNNVINEIVRNGIEPFVTLLHFDLPQASEDKYRGCLNRMFVNDFKDYSELCSKEFGDRVKYWFTINEPTVSVVYAYELEIAPPGRCSFKEGFCVFGAPPPGPCHVSTGKCTPDANSSAEPYITGHNLILAHASAVKLYR
ncbi:hypothetical protein ACLB2K_044619 [Fragaria x ananassa]